MQHIPIRDILVHKYLWSDYDESLLTKTLESLNLENMQLYIASHSFEEEENFAEFDTEEHYGTRY